MSDASQGTGWWQASDGKWYPPADTEQPGPGWWLASDGNWYPPEQRMPVKPVAKPSGAAAPTPAPRTSTRPAPAELGTPAGPAIAPTAPVAPVTSTKPAAAPIETPPAKPFGAPVKPAAAAPKGPDADPAVSPAGPKATPDSRPTLSGGLSPDLQIRVRDEQSRRDAAVLFDARKSAASRALGSISALLEQEQEQAAAPRELRETGAARAAAAAPPTVPPAPGRATLTAPKSKGKLGRVAKTALGEPETARDLPAAANDRRPLAPDVAPTVIADDAPPPPSEPPLLEVKQGTLAADIEHIGERLVIFNDRVELHDRNDRVRQVIAGGDIADVVVHKKFTGSTVTVESGTGESIVAKGLKPEQADEIRAVILKRTRAGVPSIPGAPASRPGPERGRNEPREPIVDARDPKPAAAPSDAEAAALLAMLVDLHRAGVLTDAELTEKKALVERLTQGESLAVSSPSA